MNNMKIFIVEDEEKIAQILVDYLTRDGFKTTVMNEGTYAVATIREGDPALVILDLMLPGKDGLSICQEVRRFSNVPILMLTARVDEIDRLVGLEIGADDYVCKPFLPREVVARVKSILRRVHHVAEAATESPKYRGITIDADRFSCRVDGRDVDLTPIEFRLLQTLIAHPGRVYSRDALMDASYPDRRIVSDRTVDSHIKNLRRKLAEVMEDIELIHSIYGVGYKLE